MRSLVTQKRFKERTRKTFHPIPRKKATTSKRSKDFSLASLGEKNFSSFHSGAAVTERPPTYSQTDRWICLTRSPRDGGGPREKFPRWTVILHFSPADQGRVLSMLLSRCALYGERELHARAANRRTALNIHGGGLPPAGDTQAGVREVSGLFVVEDKRGWKGVMHFLLSFSFCWVSRQKGRGLRWTYTGSTHNALSRPHTHKKKTRRRPKSEERQKERKEERGRRKMNSREKKKDLRDSTSGRRLRCCHTARHGQNLLRLLLSRAARRRAKEQEEDEKENHQKKGAGHGGNRNNKRKKKRGKERWRMEVGRHMGRLVSLYLSSSFSAI